ncbi:MAG: MBOAT family protein [Deltaproteobacteria bacterium]|nr:MBOAT family protein [Deltaproteobacteria bacterium]
MFFNSYLFIFIFLPITFLGYHLISQLRCHHLTVWWLVGASLLFFGWYNPAYLYLLTCSILVNFALGKILANRLYIKHQKAILILGIGVNLVLLGYFKYANFFINNVNTVFDSDLHINMVILPLGISFWTLQQVAYLVDAYRGKIDKHSFIDYCLFVSFFPKLISGPILRFNETIPQLTKDNATYISSENIAVGLSFFFIGLFKKVILADGIAEYATSVFDAAVLGTTLTFFEAWIGALAYTFQLYFDFSGYCDMAIGLGLIFGIRLPLNFYSPYKAVSIIDFWRRWHITLSNFLRDYLYIPLGGNRKGPTRQCINLMIVMAIAGLWHGAGWTFVIWGSLHGFYLTLNHTWQRFLQKAWRSPKKDNWWSKRVSILITFVAVTIAWVFFRAENLSAAIGVLEGLVGLNGFVLPIFPETLKSIEHLLEHLGITFASQPFAMHIGIGWILISLAICWLLPNTQQYMGNYQAALDGFYRKIELSSRQWLRWKPSFLNAVVVAAIAVFAVLGLNRASEFLYFRF